MADPKSGVRREGSPVYRSLDSLSTDDATNTDIRDNIDYLSPEWLALSEAYVRNEQFGGGLTGHEVSANGSSSVQFSAEAGHTQLKTGTTSGSLARLQYQTEADDVLGPFSFDNDSAFSVAVNILDSDADRIDYYTIGAPLAEVDGYGFKLSEVSGTPELQGVVHDDFTETTTTLLSSPGAGVFDLYARHLSGSEVQFWANSTPPDNPDGTISTNLPSGTVERPYDLSIENTTAADRRTQTRAVRAVILP